MWPKTQYNSAFEQEKETLEERIKKLESKVYVLEYATKIIIPQNPSFYRGPYHEWPAVSVSRAIEMILEHLDIVLEDIPATQPRTILKKKEKVVVGTIPSDEEKDEVR